MTPTKQDKELRRAIVNYRIKCDYYLSDRDEGVISQEEYETAISSELDTVVQLLTADRKRVALEARLDELERAKSLYFRTYRQEVTDNIGNVYVNDSHGYISSYEVQERIAELDQKIKELES